VSNQRPSAARNLGAQLGEKLIKMIEIAVVDHNAACAFLARED
jgi:hypothetical protein